MKKEIFNEEVDVQSMRDELQLDEMFTSMDDLLMLEEQEHLYY